MKQDEPEAKEIALAIELFTHGSLNTFAKPTNVDTDNRLICYDILDLGKQLMPIGMLVVLDSILNRITQNRAKGKQTFIFIDEIYLLFQHEYSANFLFTLWKRVRKYGAYATGITQNVDDLLQSHTARTMLANSEFLIMLNQASTDRIELAKLLNISDLQLSYITNLKNSPTSKYWYPVFAVMIGTGLRVGEVTGLRWCDIDLEEGIIDVNHTLVYYDHRTEGSKRGCYFNVNTTKTPAGRRKVPMLGFVKEAFLMEKERQELLDLHCEATVDGYTDFIFINRFGQPQHQATLNKAIRRIIRDCNDEQLLKDENAEVLLPHFSCHSLRHTFTTRMCEAGVNVKVIQDTLGHKDISTTLNIYTDVTKELRKSEFEGLDSYFKNEYNKVSV